MVHTCWKWIIPGQLEKEDRLLNNIPPTDSRSSSFYYTSTMTIQKHKRHWNYISSFSKNLSRSQTHHINTVLCYPKLFRSKLTLMLDNKQDILPVTVIEETEVTSEPLVYHSGIILYQNQTTRFVTTAIFTPSQLELTYIFSLKLNSFHNGHYYNCNRSRSVFWIYRRWIYIIPVTYRIVLRYLIVCKENIISDDDTMCVVLVQLIMPGYYQAIDMKSIKASLEIHRMWLPFFSCRKI